MRSGLYDAPHGHFFCPSMVTGHAGRKEGGGLGLSPRRTHGGVAQAQMLASVFLTAP